MWLESDSEAIPVPGKKYYKVNSLYVLVTDTPVSVYSDDIELTAVMVMMLIS